MNPTFFETPAAFRRWLERHHASENELFVGYHKKATGRPSITWPESVDEANGATRAMSCAFLSMNRF